MRIILHKKFEKQYTKLPIKIKKQFKIRRDIFIENPFDPRLNNHSLGGEYSGMRSINITGDLRAHYFMLKKDTALFVKLGSHSELYN